MNNIDVNLALKYFQNVVTQHYADFSGRVSRRDFWMFVLVYFVLALAVAIAGRILFLGMLMPLLQLVLLLPTSGLTARRLQDTGKNGQIVWVFVVLSLVINAVSLLAAMTFGAFGLVLLLLPLLGLLGIANLVIAVYLIYLCAQPGTAGPNAYGPQPPVETAAPGVAT